MCHNTCHRNSLELPRFSKKIFLKTLRKSKALFSKREEKRMKDRLFVNRLLTSVFFVDKFIISFNEIRRRNSEFQTIDFQLPFTASLHRVGPFRILSRV